MQFILTPKVPLSLKEMCIARTGALLRDGYYRLDSRAESTNSFKRVSAHVVDALFRVVKRANKDVRTSRVDMLRPLVTSGRVTDLDFSLCGLGLSEFIQVFDAVPQENNVRRLYVTNFLAIDNSLPDVSFASVMKSVLSKCTNIEHLIIPGEAFDAEVLLRHPKLKKLNVNFLHIRKFAPFQIDDSFIHLNLTEITINNASRNLHAPMAKILECCPNLVSVGNDIAGALKILHERRSPDGELSNKRYKLQKYYLKFPNSNKTLHTASVTCPMTNALYLDFVGDSNADMKELANFGNLDSLTVENQVEAYYMKFHSGFGYALEFIGAGIRSLYFSFVRVDFEAIGRCCPNLTELTVDCIQSYDILNPSAEYFIKMVDLCLASNINNSDAESALQFLLSSCKELHTLYLSIPVCFTDQVLDRLLQRNSFLCLKNVTISNCYLTKVGIHLLLESCRRLESINIISNAIPFREVEQIILSFNPNAHPPCSDPVLEMLNSFPNKKRNAPHSVQ